MIKGWDPTGGSFWFRVLLKTMPKYFPEVLLGDALAILLRFEKLLIVAETADNYGSNLVQESK